MRGAQLYHFSRTHKQHFGVFNVFKKLSCQTHSRCSHADGVGANLSGAAHFFGDRKATLKKLIKGCA